MAAAANPATAKSSPPASAGTSLLSSRLSPASTAMMATASARTRTRLHGFSFPALSWGTQRLLRCSKIGSSAPPPAQHQHVPSPGKEGSAGAGASQPQRPWNLRIRRSATTEPLVSRSGGAGKAAASPVLALQSPPPPQPADARKRCFSIAVTKEEIVEDFIAIHGARPPRRPKKRPRYVQRELDALFPGLLLNDVSIDSYKIDEK